MDYCNKNQGYVDAEKSGEIRPLDYTTNKHNALYFNICNAANISMEQANDFLEFFKGCMLWGDTPKTAALYVVDYIKNKL